MQMDHKMYLTSQPTAGSLPEEWYAANQRYLSAALGGMRARLEEPRGAPASPADGEDWAALGAPPALQIVAERFGLSSFERDLLLLCAGVELDSHFAGRLAELQGDPQRVYPTFSLALSILPDPHWSALAPSRPLRRWRLIDLFPGSGALTQSPLRIDERILHFLVGVEHTDERLAGIVHPYLSEASLLPSQEHLAERIARAWTNAQAGHLPVVQLTGSDPAARRQVAAAACARLGLGMQILPTLALPTEPRELEALLRLWEREAALSQWGLLLELDGMESNDAHREGAVLRLLDSMNSLVIVSGRERRPTAHRAALNLEVLRPTAAEQQAVWQAALGLLAAPLNGQIERLVAQFNLSGESILNASAQVRDVLDGALQAAAPDTPRELEWALWEASRSLARPRLDDLSQRIETSASWGDLVLPEAQLRLLREIGISVRQRATVYERWGFAHKSHRGLGISALFSGGSGTGKTLAAEILANELHLDLYRIDLSQVVSKYIGETEKNLRKLFDAAEDGGAVLLFDEADALFGKRSEVKDSHDRYANIEVSYLLQRMEAYRGLAILTTNMRSALDTAFLRRIRFIVHFPFPDAALRAEIWRRIFPPDTPTQDLDAERLAQLNLAGGNIYNIALQAAFLAAEADEPVRMVHLRRAAQTEYTKLDKTLGEAEIRGWEQPG